MKYSAFSNIQGEISKLGFGLMRLPKLYDDKEDIDYSRFGCFCYAFRSGMGSEAGSADDSVGRKTYC